MRLAVIADIHGNAWALEAILADIAHQGVDMTLNLGDVFSGPLDARRTFDLLAPLDLPTVRGNHDRYLIEQDPGTMGPSDRVAHDQLPDEALAWLGTLPPSLTLGDTLYVCHATPGDDERYWMDRVNPDGTLRPATLMELEAERERDAGGRAASLILCGHTHLARVAQLGDGTLLVNPGSVGCPAYEDDVPVPHRVEAGAPHARYALIERSAHGWEVTLRCVAYDSAPAVAAARAHRREEWARGLATGRLAGS